MAQTNDFPGSLSRQQPHRATCKLVAVYILAPIIKEIFQVSVANRGVVWSPNLYHSLIPRLGLQLNQLDKIESLGLRTHPCRVELSICMTLSSSTLESTGFPTGPANHMNRRIRETDV